MMPHGGQWFCHQQVALQVYSGAQKAGRVKTVLDTAPRIHTKVGMYVLAALTVALVTGMFKSFNKPDPAVNDFKSALAVSVLAIAYTVVAMFMSTGMYKRWVDGVGIGNSTATSVAYSPVNTSANDRANDTTDEDVADVTKGITTSNSSVLDRKPH
jgi:cytochrome b561